MICTYVERLDQPWPLFLTNTVICLCPLKQQEDDSVLRANLFDCNRPHVPTLLFRILYFQQNEKKMCSPGAFEVKTINGQQIYTFYFGHNQRLNFCLSLPILYVAKNMDSCVQHVWDSRTQQLGEAKWFTLRAEWVGKSLYAAELYSIVTVCSCRGKFARFSRLRNGLKFFGPSILVFSNYMQLKKTDFLRFSRLLLFYSLHHASAWS